MEFESKEDAFNFYKEYALSAGFSAIIKASRRSRVSGKFIDAKFVCTRYGTKRPTCSSDNPDPLKKKRGRINRSVSKTDCNACMHVKSRQDGKWIISSFINEHNHELVSDLRNNVNTRARKKKTPVSLCQPSDQSLLSFRDGDARDMLDYLSRMQDENPYFFYAIDLNREHRLRNVLWVNPKSRIDYDNFGDAVLFDTTYKKNEFKLPFVPFIGMNSHLQFVLLGCAFVADESKSTYAWVLRAWLTSMRGQAPKVILTDQDPILKEAIDEVFPDSRHCFCLWHVLSKIQEKLGYVIRKHENFVNKFYKCVLKSQTEAQFEERWLKLVGRFDLGSDGWVRSLYDDRLKWVPLFMKDVFFAGLCSTQRSESVLDRCLLRKTSLKEFLCRYDIALHEKYEDESPFEKQMATIYTNAVFKKFQVEVLGAVACHPKIENEDNNQVFKVTWDEKTSDTCCTCRFFEYNGFLCRHMMIVLQICGVNSIPEKYILRRWTKDAKKKKNREATKRADNCVESRSERYYDICWRACDLVDEGSLCQESYDVVFTALNEILRKCERISNSETEKVS
ncbi:protein far-red impaired response 1 [Phtheirospermum japonicum]|uniref:Protein FAR1-RELATED SEQUENCE n=1 Tax=Phtheirospermum japonicum TaxID=374723 RepID=A0A830CM00_9LAMI|nr:protein far-red impaired response 1 [Phtheirospermum japonicum]